MQSELRNVIQDALANLPDQEEIRRRIAENLQERQLLRQMLKLIEQRRQQTEASRDE